MKCAIIHYWLLGMRGGEKVVEGLCKLLPHADIFTLFYDPEVTSDLIKSHQVFPSALNSLRRFHRQLLPLMPFALESMDLRGYDLVMSSESGPAKGVITSSTTRHLCYCHSPMRYLWDLYPEYLHDWARSNSKRALLAIASNYLRMWDFASAARVDHFLANSRNVQRRIYRAYRRNSKIIYPPVQVDGFYHKPADDYYLAVSALVEYKRIVDAVSFCTFSGRRLKIVGLGPEYKSLKAIAGPTVEFCGRVSEFELKDLYARCRGVLMPGEEDFGIVPVEALASGKPVVALGRGGVLESVPTTLPRCGFLYDRPGPVPLSSAVRELERNEVDISPIALRNAAQRFSEHRFLVEMSEQIDHVMQRNWNKHEMHVAEQPEVFAKPSQFRHDF
jgi:glycosyltransferase involved in cell wall biosynthesis